MYQSPSREVLQWCAGVLTAHAASTCTCDRTNLHSSVSPGDLSEPLSPPCQEHTLFLVNYLPLSSSRISLCGLWMQVVSRRRRGQTWWMILVALWLRVSEPNRTSHSAGRCPNLWSVSTEGASNANTTMASDTYSKRKQGRGVIILSFLVLNQSHATCFVQQITISHGGPSHRLNSRGNKNGVLTKVTMDRLGIDCVVSLVGNRRGRDPSLHSPAVPGNVRMITDNDDHKKDKMRTSAVAHLSRESSDAHPQLKINDDDVNLERAHSQNSKSAFLHLVVCFGTVGRHVSINVRVWHLQNINLAYLHYLTRTF